MSETTDPLLSPEHHREVQRLLDELEEEGRDEDSRELIAYWRTFERDLNDHIAEEEAKLLPLYRREHPAQAAQLVEDHRRFREAAAEIAIETELHCIRAERIDELAEQLRAHALREDATLYPWAAEKVSSWTHLLERIRGCH